MCLAQLSLYHVFGSHVVQDRKRNKLNLKTIQLSVQINLI